ncbi:hypothetical protein BYT27DRAFT_7105116 [Phlegmacium glaucopus]|nr:hypothetical protein BYT27DRAFT_7105116 [Phlegmacium glaucopus]
MDAQIERHQPLITARLIFTPKAFPPPPIITVRMEFPSITILQQHERSSTPEIRKPNKKTPKPQGEAGRPQSGGYNLQDKLGWNDRTYEIIVALVHKLAKTKLNTTKSFRSQDMKIVKQICNTVSKEYPILKDYEKDWPTRDMLKLHLKYTSEASRCSVAASTAKNIEKVH